MSDSGAAVKKSWRDGNWMVLITLVMFIGLWELIVPGFGVPKIIFPAPSMIYESMVEGFASGR